MIPILLSLTFTFFIIIPEFLDKSVKTIKKDAELLYDYGDRSQKALKAHPWLKE